MLDGCPEEEREWRVGRGRRPDCKRPERLSRMACPWALMAKMYYAINSVVGNIRQGVRGTCCFLRHAAVGAFNTSWSVTALHRSLELAVAA